MWINVENFRQVKIFRFIFLLNGFHQKIFWVKLLFSFLAKSSLFSRTQILIFCGVNNLSAIVDKQKIYFIIRHLLCELSMNWFVFSVQNNFSESYPRNSHHSTTVFTFLFLKRKKIMLIGWMSFAEIFSENFWLATKSARF